MVHFLPCNIEAAVDVQIVEVNLGQGEEFVPLECRVDYPVHDPYQCHFLGVLHFLDLPVGEYYPLVENYSIYLTYYLAYVLFDNLVVVLVLFPGTSDLACISLHLIYPEFQLLLLLC